MSLTRRANQLRENKIVVEELVDVVVVTWVVVGRCRKPLADTVVVFGNNFDPFNSELVVKFLALLS